MNVSVLASFALLVTLNMVTSFSYEASDSSSAFRDNRSTHISYGKNSDGSCWRRVVTYDNGKRNDDYQIINCAVAEAEMRAEEERRAQQLREQQEKINQEFQKIQDEINEKIFSSQRKIQQGLRRTFSSFFSF